MMKTVLFSQDENLIAEWESKIADNNIVSAYDLDSLKNMTDNNLDAFMIIADYDSVATEVNKMLTANTVPKYLIVLERTPEVLIGKNLILHGVKAYGNSRMLPLHLTQLLKTVKAGKVWTYPELTAQLARTGSSALSKESLEMIQNKLTDKEQEVVLAILEGLSNDAIAKKLDVTERTVKAHVSSIFQKLHVNDRLSLVLLLKQ